MPGDSRGDELVSDGLQSGHEALFARMSPATSTKKADRPGAREGPSLCGLFKLSPDHENRKYIRAWIFRPERPCLGVRPCGQGRRPIPALDRGRLVFFGEDSGAFAALDAETGKPLWYFQANQNWKVADDLHGRRQAVRGDRLRDGFLGPFG
ncbi:MAG: hypothetical protein R2748_13645 [Bryobacterales bacterium]